MAFTPGTLGTTITPNTQAPATNIILGGVFNLSLTPGAVAANSTGVLTVGNTGLGLQVGDFLDVQFQGTQTVGILIGEAYVSAGDTINVQYANITSASATPAAGVHKINVFRVAANNTQVTPAIQQ